MSANLRARAFIRYTPSNKNLRTLHIMRELLFEMIMRRCRLYFAENRQTNHLNVDPLSVKNSPKNRYISEQSQ